MRTQQITLADNLAMFVDDCVGSGEFPDAAAVIAAALAQLRESRETNPPTLPEIAMPPRTDLARQSFDSPAFLESLMRKLQTK